MRLLIEGLEDCSDCRVVDVPLLDNTQTIAELAESLGLSGPGLTIDGQFVEPDRPALQAGLRNGSSIRAGRANLRNNQSVVGTLDVVSGLIAGSRYPLRPGRHLVGRHQACDFVLSSPTVSRRHARLEVADDQTIQVADVGSTNGTWAVDKSLSSQTEIEWGSAIRLGSITVKARGGRSDAPHHLASERVWGGACEQMVFNRRPRAQLPQEAQAVELPTRAIPDTRPQRFSWSMILVPVVLGGLMALILDPRFALFMMLSPLMTITNWWENKHRLRLEKRRIERRFEKALEGFAAGLSDHVTAEQERRRSRHVDLAELHRRAAAPSVQLWERRAIHGDFLELSIGRGSLAWSPPTVDGDPPEVEVAELLAGSARLEDVPIDVSLLPGSVLGFSGNHSVSCSVARALLLQAAVHHGPADVEIAVMCAPDRAGEWEWLSMLPHTIDRRSGGEQRLMAPGREAATLLADRLLVRDEAETHTTLIVVDGDQLLSGRDAPGRRVALAGGAISVLVVADELDWLPATTSQVVETHGEEGLGALFDPKGGHRVCDVCLDGVAIRTAWDLARAMAALDDPEMRRAGVGIPQRVELLQLLGGDVSPGGIGRRWDSTVGTTNIVAPIGVDSHGVVSIDLVADGPHALIGGTTGSGKSELLRSLVASMAASADAEHLSFVLIDYKGGSAFDHCADLPHTVGVVTDLDPHLSERALRCLDAELEYRERLLRRHGVDSIVAYRAKQVESSVAELEPLSRLIVVIDEFATMAAELPEFVDALVGIAQRGRSLGVHLILATQRPSGSISDNIRTNTNLRIALRVLDRGDSSDVIGSDEAASIGRDTPGRAALRLGPNQIVNFQSALSTGRSGDGDGLIVSQVRFGRVGSADPSDAEGPTDLERMVTAIASAHKNRKISDPRCPWPEPLAAQVSLTDAFEVGVDSVEQATGSTLGQVVIGVVDDPDQQCHAQCVWDPNTGNALIAGAQRSGTTSALRTLVVSSVRQLDANGLHVFILDFGRGELDDLESLDHVGAVIGSSDTERQQRLLRSLAKEVRRRKAAGGRQGDDPSILLVLDGLDAFRREFEDDFRSVADLETVYLDGVAVGVHTATSASSPTMLRNLATATRFHLYLRLSEAADLREIGVSGAIDPDPVPGRGHVGPTGLVVQVAKPVADDLDEVRSCPSVDNPPWSVGTLSSEIAVAEMASSVVVDESRLFVPLGRSESDLRAVGFDLGAGDHALIAGPGRSGCTATLLTVATLLQGRIKLRWLGAAAPVDWIDTTSIDQVSGLSDRSVLFIDNVETVEDDGSLLRLLEQRDGRVHIIAAGRIDRLRAAYGHWTIEFRQVGRGVLLRPDVLDGDVLGVDVPGRLQPMINPGRGLLIAEGRAECLQVAISR
ncbi:MAG: FtsK/SpoIIIE domain-containing protein [Acidimicrobiales bacterium]